MVLGRRRVSLVIGLMVALVLSACAPAPTAAPVATPSRPMGPLPAPTGAAQASRPPKAGDQAQDFTLNDLQGKPHSLSDFRGQKVMLNFWATWCGPCRIEIPYMVKLYHELQGQGFEIIAVNLREDPAKVASFVKQLNMPFPILLDKSGQVGAAYYVYGIPTSIFLDEHGVIKAVHVGTLTEQALRNYVNALMHPSP